MNCPACGDTLHELSLAGLALDACSGGCGGIWFDRGELQKVDEEGETEGEAIERIPAVDLTEVLKGRYACPRCEGTAMMRHFTSVLHEVEVDECPGCGGYWLDAGELARIRDENREPGGREKLKSAAAMGGRVAGYEARSQAEVETYRNVTKICRLLRLRRMRPIV